MKQMRFFHSIRNKLLFSAFILLIIPLLVLGIFGYTETKDSLTESGAKRLKYSVQMTLEMIEALHTEVESGNITLDEAQEKVKVAILGPLNEDGSRPINDNLDLGENGYPFILSQEGILLANPVSEGLNVWNEEDENGVKFAQEQINIANDGGGLHYYDWTLPNSDTVAQKIAYVETDPHWNWIVGAGAYLDEFNAPANNVLHIIFIVVSITLVIGVVFIWIFSNRMARPIQHVTDQMARIADGDLSGEPLKVTSKDETGKLATALNHMQESLTHIIGNVAHASRTITRRSEELNQATEEVHEGTLQIVSTMEELATGSENQANNSSAIASMMSDFVTSLEEANENGTHVSESSKRALHLTKRGSELMKTSTEQMQTIDEIVKEAVDKVEGLDTHAQEISELVSVIHDIAEQTNLLALNAAIEAARAGEHGQGFAVVADEVRKLAEQAAASVGNITHIVEAIQTESASVVTSLQTGYKEVEQGTEHIVMTDETFTEIHDAMTYMVENINGITNNIAEIVSSSQEINSSVEDIAAVSEQSAAGVEETTATTEETSAAMEQVAASSTNLSNLAEQLNEIVGQFNIK